MGRRGHGPHGKMDRGDETRVPVNLDVHAPGPVTCSLQPPRQGAVWGGCLGPGQALGSLLPHITSWQGLWAPGLLSPAVSEGRPQPSLSHSASHDPVGGCPFCTSPSPGTGKLWLRRPQCRSPHLSLLAPWVSLLLHSKHQRSWFASGSRVWPDPGGARMAPDFLER